MNSFILRSIVLLVSLFYSSLLFSQSTRQSNSADEVFEIPDESAMPATGLPAFNEYLSSSIIYPISARLNNKEGTVYVSFIVNELGYIELNSVEAVLGIDPACDLEAIRVVKKYREKWTPAKLKGKAIRQRLCLPINFVLTDDDNQSPVYHLKTVVKTNPAKTSGNK